MEAAEKAVADSITHPHSPPAVVGDLAP